MLSKYNILKDEIVKWSRTKCLVVGDVMLDHYINGSVNRISPEAPVPVLDVENTTNRLGGAANVALNLIQLGAEVELLSVLGDDETGNTLLEMLTAKNIRTKHILKSASRKTTKKNRLISKNQQLLRFDSETTDEISKEVEDKLYENLLLSIEKSLPDILIFQDYDKGVLTKSFIEKTISICRQKKIKTAVDPKRKNFFNYSGVDLFKPNLKELCDAFNLLKINDESELLSQVEKLRIELNVTNCMVTLSEKGICYVSPSNSFVTKPNKLRTITDVSGAGDTVLSVASLALAGNLEAESLVFLANLSGGIVCEYPGVYPISKELLLKDLNYEDSLNE
ncbi:MAG: hypothetical protein EA412_07100 [Chitinophagaceae bacterium]|nr:MAG: hypothetical protein EA412_07100 [Chitinophagaceae bacterium]